MAIIDYKVSEDKERDDRYRLQLTVYAAAGKGEGLDVEAAYLHELKEGTRGIVDITDDSRCAAIGKVSGLLKGIRNGQFLPTQNTVKCQGCDFKKLCSHCPGIDDDCEEVSTRLMDIT